jgi:hypothetical protein
MDSGRGNKLAKSVLGSSYCHYKGVFTCMDSGCGHQLARSAKKYSNDLYKGVFTRTVAVAISGPSQY